MTTGRGQGPITRAGSISAAAQSSPMRMKGASRDWASLSATKSPKVSPAEPAYCRRFGQVQRITAEG
jgi:hypothetical protein